MCATGDEVLQWNGVPLQSRSAEEVSVVVADSKHDSHVELVVSRPITAARAPAQPWRTHKGMICYISLLSALYLLHVVANFLIIILKGIHHHLHSVSHNCHVRHASRFKVDTCLLIIGTYLSNVSCCLLL